jgi:hypothetical protein
MILTFDIEADGLLEDATGIHCVCVKEYGKEVVGFDGIKLLDVKHYFERARAIVGHNIISYDIPMLKKFLGLELGNIKIYDTFLMSMLSWAEIGRAHV